MRVRSMHFAYPVTALSSLTKPLSLVTHGVTSLSAGTLNLVKIHPVSLTRFPAVTANLVNSVTKFPRPSTNLVTSRRTKLTKFPSLHVAGHEKTTEVIGGSLAADRTVYRTAPTTSTTGSSNAKSPFYLTSRKL